jgi:hypothetical protein
MCGRDGVVLTNKGDRALIKTNPDKNIISIAVTGKPETTREFLTLICTQLEKINASTPGITAIKKEGKLEETEKPAKPKNIPEPRVKLNPPETEVETQENNPTKKKSQKIPKWAIYVGLFLIVVLALIIFSLIT